MLGHLGVYVPDLARAKRYYDAVMPLLGYAEFMSAPDEFAYRPAGDRPGTYLFFYPSAEPSTYSRHATGLQHLAFKVRTRTAVREVYDAAGALAAEFGGQTLHAPQTFPQYPPPYFAAFWLDPWGVMLEAGCHHDRD